MNLRRKLVVVGLACVSLLLVGCEGSSSDDTSSDSSSSGSALPKVASPAEVQQATYKSLEGKKVRLALLVDGIPLTDTWVKGLTEGFNEAGIDFDYNSAGFDQAVLARNVETYINEKPDVLMIHNGDLSGVASLIQKAEDEGIYVIVVNLASNAQSDIYFGGDWDKVFAEVMGLAADDCQDNPQVAVISGLGSDAASVLSNTAFERVAKERGIDIVANQPGFFDPNKGAQAASTIMQQHPDLCAFVGIADSMMIGVANAVAQAGKQGDIKVYSNDNTQGVCDAIGKGLLTASVSYGGGDMAPQLVSLAKYLLVSGMTPGANRTAVYSSTKVIDKSNYDQVGACYGGSSQ
jgi:ribose transport system substrate-binding protein